MEHVNGQLFLEGRCPRNTWAKAATWMEGAHPRRTEPLDVWLEGCEVENKLERSQMTPKMRIFVLFWSFVFLGLHPRHLEVPRLGVESKLQLLASTTATATQDLSRVCDLHHSSRQHQILNPQSEARDQTRNLKAPSWIRFCCATTGTPEGFL